MLQRLQNILTLALPATLTEGPKMENEFLLNAKQYQGHFWLEVVERDPQVLQAAIVEALKTFAEKETSRGFSLLNNDGFIGLTMIMPSVEAGRSFHGLFIAVDSHVNRPGLLLVTMK